MSNPMNPIQGNAMQNNPMGNNPMHNNASNFGQNNQYQQGHQQNNSRYPPYQSQGNNQEGYQQWWVRIYDKNLIFLENLSYNFILINIS